MAEASVLDYQYATESTDTFQLWSRKNTPRRKTESLLELF